MNEVVAKENNIENMIYEVRGKQVMLDRDLAILYKCKNGTKVVNQAVSRHKDRFPSDFCFQLTNAEYNNLKSQHVTSNTSNYGGVRKLPYVFTEQGVAMLATILRTEVASIVSIDIMRAFVSMRKYISSNMLEQKYINNQVIKNTEDIRLLQESFKKFEDKKIINEIYFNGMIYDAYSKILDIMHEATKELIIIDSYVDKTLLDMIRKIKVNVLLITKEKNNLSILDISRYNEEYHNLKVIYDNTYHDRYIIIDSSIVYHLGTSINHAGSKTFSINLLTDQFVIDSLLDKIVKNI